MVEDLNVWTAIDSKWPIFYKTCKSNLVCNHNTNETTFVKHPFINNEVTKRNVTRNTGCIHFLLRWIKTHKCGNPVVCVTWILITWNFALHLLKQCLNFSLKWTVKLCQNMWLLATMCAKIETTIEKSKLSLSSILVAYSFQKETIPIHLTRYVILRYRDPRYVLR